MEINKVFITRGEISNAEVLEHVGICGDCNEEEGDEAEEDGEK